MKRIILGVLVLVFSFGSFISVFWYTIDEGSATIKELIKKLEWSDYIFTKKIDNNNEYYEVFYNSKKAWIILANSEWIRIYPEDYDVIWKLKYYTNNNIEEILIQFYKYPYEQLQKKIKNIIVKWENEDWIIKILPTRREIIYIWLFFENNDVLFERFKKDNLGYIDIYKLLADFQGLGFSLNMIDSPDFVKYMISEEWYNYLDINYNDFDINENKQFNIKFEILVDGIKTWIIKDLTLEVIEPIVLLEWELWPKWWTLFNDWEDITLSIEKWKLDKMYKFTVIWIKEESESYSLITLSIPEWLPSLLSLNSWAATRDYIFWDSKSVYNLIEWKDDYNNCIKNSKRSEKYECYKKYMWFSLNDEEIVITKIEEIKTKSQLIKQLILSKHNIEKLRKWKSYIYQFDLFIDKLSDEKLEILTRNLWRLSEEVRNNKTYKYIFDYLEAKALLKLNH